MKKHLLLFPLLAGLVLSGCEFEIFGTKISLFEKEEEKKQEQKQEENKEGGEQKEGEGEGGEEDEGFKITNQPVLKETFGSYKMAKSVQEGKRYILAAYKHDHDKMLVFNGDYHRDAKGFYPFYLGGQLDSVEDAAEVEIHMVSETEFTIQVHSTHAEWDGKYIGVYSAVSGYSNKVMSIAVLDSPTQETYTDPKSGNQTDQPSAIFKFHGEEFSGQIFAPAADYLYKDVDEEKVPKFMGTSGDYQSIDCKSYEVALDGESYDLAHFYELAE